MKKFKIFSALVFVSLFIFTSCERNKTQLPTLNTQIDTLNYAYGLASGNIINNFYLLPYKTNPDSLDKKSNLLLDGMDKAMETETDSNEKPASQDEFYQLGLQFGNSFKTQLTDGLLNESTLAFNYKIVRQGIVNAVKDFSQGMTTSEAEIYVQKTLKTIQDKKSAEQAPQTAAPDSTSVN